MFLDYSYDESDVIDQESPALEEPVQGPVRGPEKSLPQNYYSRIYKNPKSVEKWIHIIQYFLAQLDLDLIETDNWNLEEDLVVYIEDKISDDYNVDHKDVMFNLGSLIRKEVNDYVWVINWKPSYKEDKYLKRAPAQPKRMPELNYKSYQGIGLPGYGYRSRYEHTYDKIDEQKAIDWLLKYYKGTTFSVDTIVGFLEDYVFKYKDFGKGGLETFIKSLPEKHPEQFQLFGNKIHIGISDTNLEFNQTEPQPEINHDELQEIALSNIEDFKKYGEATETKDGMYIFIDRGSNILAVAHLDTVQNKQHYYTLEQEEEETIHNAQLDDRLGAYIILEVLPRMGVNADILLTEGEETGNSTAKYFVPTKSYNWIFEFDRAGTDAVLYQYEDEATKKLLEDHGIHVGKGSFSDTALLDHLGVKAFNFGTGAYESHNEKSHAVVSQVKHCVSKFVKFYNSMKDTVLPHKTDERYYRSRY